MAFPSDPPHEKIALLYMSRCGTWYVHSHRLYATVDEARQAAEKFLPVNTPVAFAPITAAMLIRELVQ